MRRDGGGRVRPPVSGGTILITGASSGMGQEFARTLAPHAKRLLIVARRGDRLEGLAAELRRGHPDLDVTPLPCDLTDPDAVERLVEQIQRTGEAVDILINCAGSVGIGFFEEASFESIETMIRLNVTALTHLTRLLLPEMIARKSGGILNLASFFGLELLPGYAAYAGTKHYVRGFTETLRAECAGTGVVVSGAYPGPVKSPFWQVEHADRFEVPSWLYLSVEQSVREMVSGFRRGRAQIVPGLRIRLLVVFLRFSPSFVKRLVNGLLARRIRKRESTRDVAPPVDRIDWSFGGSWPFEPKWHRTRDGRLHYIDEGSRTAPPVLLVHGNPTWGYLYRHFVPPLVDAGYRVIVPDHLGFGRSDKPDIAELYRIPRHAERFEELLESLDLQDVTVVPHDWGGPIALAWAGRHPDRIARLFILNTFAHEPLEPYDPPIALKLFRRRGIGELLVKGFQIFVRGFLFRQGIVKHERMTAAVKRAYLTPNPTWRSRNGILVFPREIPVTLDAPLTPFLHRVEQGLERLRGRPVLVAWGMRDPVFRSEFIDQFWTRTFPDARVEQIADAGHYLQEDAHETLVPMLLDFLRSTDAERTAPSREATGK